MQRSGRVLVPIFKALPKINAQQPSRTFFSRRFLVPAARRIDDHFRDVERYFDRMERDMAASPFSHPFGKIFVSDLPSRPSPMSIYESETPGKYKVNVVIGDGIPPENIKVTLNDRIVKIEAKYEHTAEDGTSSVTQEFMRQFTLPENVKIDEVKSLYTPEGVLQIEAPIPIPEIDGSRYKEIPISIETKAKDAQK